VTILENVQMLPKLFESSESKFSLMKFILATFASYLLGLRLHYAARLSINGISYRVPLRKGDLGVINEIQIRRVYEKVSEYIVQDGDICVDIGANIGSVSLIWSKTNKKGAIVALEPHPETFERLKNNLNLNGVSNIMAIHAAIARRSGSITICLDSGSNMAHVEGVEMETHICAAKTKVPSYSLDDLISHCNLEKVDLLKVDVEGYEVQCLEGGDRTLDGTRRILLEYHSEALRHDCERILRKKGFTVKDNYPIMFGWKEVR